MFTVTIFYGNLDNKTCPIVEVPLAKKTVCLSATKRDYLQANTLVRCHSPADKSPASAAVGDLQSKLNEKTKERQRQIASMTINFHRALWQSTHLRLLYGPVIKCPLR